MSPTPSRCFVHVGLPKTGTSYLQNAFWRSREQLADGGVRMLMSKRVDHFHSALAVRGLLDADMDPAEAFTALDRLAESVQGAAHAGGDAFFSHEFLAPATPEQAGRLVDLLGDFEVHVVITARDLARQVASGWQQRIQGREEYSYPEFLDALVQDTSLAQDFWLNQDVAAVAARWATQVPAERVHVVTVPPAGAPVGALLDRFCHVMDVEPGRVSAETAQNESLGYVQAELLRRVNVALGDRIPHARAGYGRVGKAFLAHQVLAPQNGRPPQLPADLVDWCRNRSAAMIDELREVGYPVSGSLDDLVPAPTEAAAAASAVRAVSDAELNAAAVEALATILALRLDETSRLDDLRARVRAQRQRIREITEEKAAGGDQSARPAWARAVRRMTGTRR